MNIQKEILELLPEKKIIVQDFVTTSMHSFGRQFGVIYDRNAGYEDYNSALTLSAEKLSERRVDKYILMNIIEKSSRLDMDYHGKACEAIADAIDKDYIILRRKEKLK